MNYPILLLLVSYYLDFAFCKKIILSNEFLNIYAKKNCSNLMANIKALTSNANELETIDDPSAKVCSASSRHAAEAFITELKVLGFDPNIRQKRSLLPLVGNVWSFISGSPSESDFSQMRQSFEALKTWLDDARIR